MQNIRGIQFSLKGGEGKVGELCGTGSVIEAVGNEPQSSTQSSTLMDLVSERVGSKNIRTSLKTEQETH